MSDVEQRLAALEARTTAAEDELAIIRLIASYGPYIDCGSVDLAPGLLTADATYVLNIGQWNNRAEFVEALREDSHQELVSQSIAHIMGLPWVRVRGNEAVATNITQLFVKEGENFIAPRVGHNIWKLVKTEDGWKVKERVNCQIGEREVIRAFLEGVV